MMDPIAHETPQSVDPVAPVTPEGHMTTKRAFKMRLSPDDADRLKSWAHQNELSQADYVRYMVFGRTTFGPPNASKLESICRQLAGIGANLNQAQHAINSAQANGTLTESQFAAMHKAISAGLEAWAEPLSVLRAELKKLKPAAETFNELDAG